MPNVTVSLDDEAYDEVKGPHRSARLRELLKERRDHKCPSPDEYFSTTSKRRGFKNGWVYRSDDGTQWDVSRKKG